MRDVYDNYKHFAQKAYDDTKTVREYFSYEKASVKPLVEAVDEVKARRRRMLDKVYAPGIIEGEDLRAVRV
jgi:hypothetical protein